MCTVRTTPYILARTRRMLMFAFIGNARLSRIVLVGGLIVTSGCLESGPTPTEDPETSVVKMRNKLMEFAKGNLNEVTGETQPDESFVLIYGYPTQPLKSLPISDTLKRNLRIISPPSTEKYVLAHVYRDEITEFTEWECTGENFHRQLEPTVFVIQGNPFRITKREETYWMVDMKIE